MNIAVPFTNNFKYLDQPVQFNINYKPEIKKLDDFIAKYGNHRINLIIKNFKSEEDIEIIKVLREKYPECELVSCLPFYAADLEQMLTQNGLPHYYNELISSWDRFNGFLSLDVTDIFIADELMFSAKLLSTAAKQNGKALRAFCNVCQSSWDKTPSLKTFFVRPEDLSLYEGLIDTFEFYVDERDATKISALYEIYTKDKSWYGKLSEIIVGYEGKEDNRFILPRFGQKRLNCQKVCVRGLHPTCHICDRIKELEQTLKAEKIAIVFDKK